MQATRLSKMDISFFGYIRNLFATADGLLRLLSRTPCRGIAHGRGHLMHLSGFKSLNFIGNKKHHPKGWCFCFWWTITDSTADFAQQAKSYGYSQFLNWLPQYAGGILHLSGFESCDFGNNKKHHPKGWCFCYWWSNASHIRT